MRKIVLGLLLSLAGVDVALAADNTMLVTPCAVGCITTRSKDVGAGVQAGAVVEVDAVGNLIYGTAGTANANVQTVQGIASMTPFLTNPGTAANWGVGATGAAVPANSTYMGVNVGGNLVGFAPGTAGTASTQVLSVQGIAAMTPLFMQGPAAAGAALAGNPVRLGLSDGTNAQNWDTALVGLLGDGVNGNNTAAMAPWVFNGASWDRMPGTTKGTYGIIRDAAGNARGANVDANGNLGAVLAAETTKVIGTVNQGTSPWVVSGTVTANPGNVANTTPWLQSISQGGNTAVVKAGNAAGATDFSLVVADPGVLAAVNAQIPACTSSPCNNIGSVGQVSQYPAGAVPITASGTGTTTTASATLAASAGGLFTYMCTLSVRSNATAAAQGHITMTGLTTNFAYAHWTAPVASGIGVTEMVYTPCVKSSATNTAIVVTSPTIGAGGDVTVNLSGYQGN